MKEKSLFFEKTTYFFSLHMKRKIQISENEKYFDFPKMDKKNVQNRYAKTLLTEKNSPYDVEKLWCQIKR